MRNCAELQDENSVLISRDEFRKLQNTNTREREPENEIIALGREREATLNDARLARETTAENERLNKDSGQLAEKLKTCKSAIVHAESRQSDERHKLLTTAVQAVWGQQDVGQAEPGAHRNSKSSDSVLTPLSTNLPLPPCRVADSDSKSITLETYNSLVTKYNQVFQNWTDIKATRTQLEKSLRAEKDKSKRYNLFCDGLEKKLAQKRDKIRQLEGRVWGLEREIQNLRQSNIVEVAQEAEKKINAGRLKDATRTFEPAAVNARHECQVEANFDSTVVDNIVTLSPLVEFPTSNNLGLSSWNVKQPDPDSRPGGRDNADDSSLPPGRHHEPEPNELPMISDGERARNHAARDAPYKLTEPFYSSSADDCDLNSPSPTNSNGLCSAIKTELHENIQSLQDIPVIVHERSVKKRKPHKSPRGASKIKVETISSSPIGLAAMHELDAQESIDLDDIGKKQMTPRKQRALMHNLARLVPHGSRSVSRPSRNFRQETESARLPSSILKGAHISQETPMDRSVFRTGSAPQSANCANEIMPGTSTHRATKRRRVTHDIAIQELADDGEKLGAIESSTSLSEWLDSDGRLIELLDNPTPSSHAEIKTAPPAPANSLENNAKLPAVLNATPSVRALSIPSGRMSLASDLSVTISPSEGINPRRLEDAPKNHARDSRPKSRDNPGCLHGGDDPAISTNYSVTSSELLTLAHEVLPKGAAIPQLAKAVDIAAPNPRRSSSTKNGITRPQDSDSNIKDEPENGPLRFRPLSKLGLHDFKINPEYNNGYDYAFTDVVRKQAARRCLPGCTKPECCGNVFRALAAAAYDPNKPLTASQEEAETRLLKEFLGDNAYKIRNMTRAERDEVLLQAKTRDLANKHGKHRHAYERRRSPPGFWRMDFPSTQEEREDRQKVEQLERDVVAQRYNQAMRPRGAYLFRDE